MLLRGTHVGPVCALMLTVLCGCAQQASAPADLSASLKGIEQSKFLSCSGPPIVEQAEAGQDRMSFVTNLNRGSVIGIASPTAMPVQSCSVDAVFQSGRLVNSTFSGDQSMCSMVFGPCLR